MAIRSFRAGLQAFAQEARNTHAAGTLAAERASRSFQQYCGRNKASIIAGVAFTFSSFAAWYLGPLTLCTYVGSAIGTLAIGGVTAAKVKSLAEKTLEPRTLNTQRIETLKLVLERLNTLYHKTPTEAGSEADEVCLQELLLKPESECSIEYYRSLLIAIETESEALFGLPRLDQTTIDCLRAVEESLDQLNQDAIQQNILLLVEEIFSLTDVAITHPALEASTFMLLEYSEKLQPTAEEIALLNASFDKALTARIIQPDLFANRQWENKEYICRIITLLTKTLNQEHPLQDRLLDALNRLQPKQERLSLADQLSDHLQNNQHQPLPALLLKEFDAAYNTSLEQTLTENGFRLDRPIVQTIRKKRGPKKDESQMDAFLQALVSVARGKGFSGPINSQESALIQSKELLKFISKQ